MQIEYAAPHGVRKAIEALGRTEDVSFSPDNRRLAVAGFGRDRIFVFDIDIGASEAGASVSLTGALELSSPVLQRPHGVDFIDNDTLVVANRRGAVVVLRLPPGEPGVRAQTVTPIVGWRAGSASDAPSPGSVAVAPLEGDVAEVLICNNYVHTVTRNRLDLPVTRAPTANEVLIRKWLDIPDGVTVSRDRRWLAVSNHGTHRVLVYDYSSPLSDDSDPVAVLRGARYPHGLRFSADGGRLFVADAGAPAVHVYATDPGGWCGVQGPTTTISAMDEAVFARGHVNPQEGGPKGVDVSADGNVLVTTTEFQPLAFFDASALLGARDRLPVGPVSVDGGASDRSQLVSVGGPVRAELELMGEEARTSSALVALEARARSAEAELQVLTNSASWRITAPLRRVRSILRR